MPPAAKRKKSTTDSTSGPASSSSSSKWQPADGLRFLLGASQMDVHEFMNDVFEKRYMHVAGAVPQAMLPRLFTLEQLKQRLSKDLTLHWHTDMQAMKYSDGQRQNKVHEFLPKKGSSGAGEDPSLVKITKQHLDKAMRSGITLQVLQPHRHSSPLLQLVAALEEEFGALVGSNIYITPPESQGLAPHHDDIEAFVLQLEGQKEWHLYRPVQTLPTTYSGDFSHAELGEPLATVVLSPGDLLYFPRGLIHEARAIGDTHSTHITISTYQRQSYGEFLKQGLPFCVERAMQSQEALRMGIPPKTVLAVSSYASQQSPAGGQHFHDAIRQLLAGPGTLDAILSHVGGAMDNFALDYIHHRLPPQAREGKLEEGADISAVPVRLDGDMVVKVPHPTHLRLAQSPGDDQTWFLHSGLHNSIVTHMMASGQQDDEDDEDDEEGADDEEDEEDGGEDEGEDDEEDEDEADEEDEENSRDGEEQGPHGDPSILPLSEKEASTMRILLDGQPHEIASLKTDPIFLRKLFLLSILVAVDRA